MNLTILEDIPLLIQTLHTVGLLTVQESKMTGYGATYDLTQSYVKTQMLTKAEGRGHLFWF